MNSHHRNEQLQQNELPRWAQQGGGSLQRGNNWTIISTTSPSQQIRHLNEWGILFNAESTHGQTLGAHPRGFKTQRANE